MRRRTEDFVFTSSLSFTASSDVATRLPSMSTMISPARTSASAQAESGFTCVMSAPFTSSPMAKRLRSSAFKSVTVTPSRTSGTFTGAGAGAPGVPSATPAEGRSTSVTEMFCGLPLR